MARLTTYVFIDSTKTILEEVDLMNDEAAESRGELLVTKTKKPVFVYSHITTIYPEEADHD